MPENIQTIQVTEDLSAAFSILKNSKIKILPVLNQAGAVTGIFTDGDLRRLALRKIRQDAACGPFSNQHFYHLTTAQAEKITDSEIETLRQEYGVKHIPVLDARGHLVRIISGPQPLPSTTPVVIMAGGLGSRMGSLTSDTPKPMLPVRGKPMLQHIVERLVNQGFEDITMVVNYRSDVIQNHFGDGNKMGCRIRYISEASRKGTAGGLHGFQTQGPVVVANGDVLCDIDFRDLVKHHRKSGADITAVAKTVETMIPFGVIETGIGGRFERVVEKPTVQHLTLSGIYVLNQAALDRIPDDFFDMPDLLNSGLEVNLYGLFENWRDVGTPRDLQEVNYETF